VCQVNRGASVAVQLPAEVVRADVLGQVKAVGEVRRWQPLPVARRKVDAGHSGVVGADPATQGDLPDHQQQPRRRPVLQASRHRQCGQYAGQAQGQQKQQAQGRKAAKQMSGDNLRPELECHRPHAERGLSEHYRQQEQRQLHRLSWMPAMDPGPTGQHRYQQPQRAGEVAVDHLVPAFMGFYRRVRKMQFGMGQLRFAFRHADKAVAARPVRTAQACVGQAGISTEQHHNQCQQGVKPRETKSRLSQGPTPLRYPNRSTGSAGH